MVGGGGGVGKWRGKLSLNNYHGYGPALPTSFSEA